MTDAAPEAIDEEAAIRNLGDHVRRLRGSRGLTLVQLAELTALSHSFLSQLERGLAQPSMGSLRRIALGLGTSPIELIAAAEDSSPDSPAIASVEVRRAEQAAPHGGFAEGEARMLSRAERPFHPLEVSSRNDRPGELFQHEEDEFLYVIEGRVLVDLGGEVSELGPADSAYYAGGTAHRWWSADGAPYRLLVVKQRARLGSARPH